MPHFLLQLIGRIYFLIFFKRGNFNLRFKVDKDISMIVVNYWKVTKQRSKIIFQSSVSTTKAKFQKHCFEIDFKTNNGKKG